MSKLQKGDRLLWVRVGAFTCPFTDQEIESLSIIYLPDRFTDPIRVYNNEGRCVSITQYSRPDFAVLSNLGSSVSDFNTYDEALAFVKDIATNYPYIVKK